jgi:hypothetical protein
LEEKSDIQSKNDSETCLLHLNKKGDDKSAPYLDLPSTRDDLEEQGIHRDSKVPLFCGPFTLSQRDSFQINTFVIQSKNDSETCLLHLNKKGNKNI